MRILIITQSFPPEMGALPSRMYPFAAELARAGHEVFVATCMPNYPKGKIFDSYRRKISSREHVDGYTVLRSWSYCVPRNISKLRQLLSYLSFIPAVLFSGLRAGPVDVVFVTSPPIFPAVAAMMLAKLRSSRLVFDIRDMWPDELVACGAATAGSFPVRLIAKLERFIYRASDAICCTTRAFMATVIGRGAHASKVHFLPNGADLQLFQLAHNDAQDLRSEQMRGKFVVLFSGILGIKQGLDTLLAAAKIIAPEENIVFQLVGGGSREAEVQQHARQLGLTNVIFSGEKKLQEIPSIIQAADVCVSLLMPDPYLQKIVSVKIYEYFACAKPVIGAHDGESARIVREADAGLVVPPGNPAELANAILRLRDDDRLRESFGARGRRYVEQFHSRADIARNLERILSDLVNPQAGSPAAVTVPAPEVQQESAFKMDAAS